MMKSSLLIVTLQPGFGAFIRGGLDPSQFDTYITSDFSEAVHYIRQNDCPTVLLDAQLENQELSVMDIGFALRQLKPVIRFVLVVRPGQDVDGENLTPLATLTAPVSLPELSRLLINPAQIGKSRITMDQPMPEFKP